MLEIVFFYVLCFTRPRYQVSVYRTIGPLVLLHLVLLPVFYHIFGTKIKVCKDNCGEHQLKLIFANL